MLNNSIPTLPSNSHIKTFGLLILFLSVLTLSVNAEPLVLTKSSFSITFQSGYALTPFLPGTDSAFYLSDTTAGETVITGRTHSSSNAIAAALYISTFSQVTTGSMVRTDSGTKTLGSNVFSNAGYKEVGAKADTTNRFRIYVTTKGNVVFVAQLVYSTTDGSASVARFEEALKTLSIQSTGIIRVVSFKQFKQRNAFAFDLKGRFVHTLK